MIKGEEQAKKNVLKDFIKDWRRGIEAKANGDPEQGNAYHTNAFARAKVVGMDNDEIMTAIALGNRGYESAIDASDWSLVTKGDVSKRDARTQQWKRKQNMKAQ
jgi:hypothetical protein